MRYECCVCKCNPETIRKSKDGRTFTNYVRLIIKNAGFDSDWKMTMTCDDGLEGKTIICLDCIKLIKRLPFSSLQIETPF